MAWAPSTGGAPHSYRYVRLPVDCERYQRQTHEAGGVWKEGALRYAHKRSTNAHYSKSPLLPRPMMETATCNKSAARDEPVENVASHSHRKNFAFCEGSVPTRGCCRDCPIWAAALQAYLRQAAVGDLAQKSVMRMVAVMVLLGIKKSVVWETREATGWRWRFTFM